MNFVGIGTLVLAAVTNLAISFESGPPSPGRTGDEWVYVLAPTEGSTVHGGTVHVVFELPDASHDPRRRSTSRPEIYVFLDDMLKGKTTDAHNDFKMEGVTPGAHTVAWLAKDSAGRISARKEIHFMATHRAPD